MHVGGAFPNKKLYASLLDIHLSLSALATPSDCTLVNVFPNGWLYACLLDIHLWLRFACDSLRWTFRREMHVGGVFPNRWLYACLLDIHLSLSALATPSD